MDVGMTASTAHIIVRVDGLRVLFGNLIMTESTFDRLYGDLTIGMFFQVIDVSVATGTGVASMGRCGKSTIVYFIMAIKALIN
jgi:hypothetical protein